ncbi:MAG: hypothetical protein RDU41_10315, partial [Clostridia bacterium]|nr:hypothetical protein [Clostridia bacterium]
MRHHRLPALTAVTLFVLDQMLKAYFATAVRIPIVEPHFFLFQYPLHRVGNCNSPLMALGDGMTVAFSTLFIGSVTVTE